jgi:hypothetical protein
MAKTTTWGYENSSSAAHRTAPLYDLGILENYALVLDEPTECRLINTTAPVDKEEVVSFRAKSLPRVNTSLVIQNPGPVAGGIQYQVQSEAVLTTEDPDTGFRVDEPVIVQISVRHPNSGNISPSAVDQQIRRTISYMMTDDGEWRIKELMRSALKPTVD